MDLTIAKKLISLNQDFYNQIGPYFNHSRDYAWEGWDKLLSYISSLNLSSKLRVLDIGCGNGRFYDFLQQNFSYQVDYCGLDFSEYLLTKARDRLQVYLKAQWQLLQLDILDKDWTEAWKEEELSKFNLIVAFGLLHHIPSAELRLGFFNNCRQYLSKDGYLIFTTWQYLDVPRLRKRLVSKDSELFKQILTNYQISADELEANDNILDWQKGRISYRYSHYYTQEEIEQLLAASGFKLEASFLADGREGNINRYFVTKLV